MKLATAVVCSMLSGSLFACPPLFKTKWVCGGDLTVSILSLNGVINNPESVEVRRIQHGFEEFKRYEFNSNHEVAQKGFCLDNKTLVTEDSENYQDSERYTRRNYTLNPDGTIIIVTKSILTGKNKRVISVDFNTNKCKSPTKNTTGYFLD